MGVRNGHPEPLHAFLNSRRFGGLLPLGTRSPRTPRGSLEKGGGAACRWPSRPSTLGSAWVLGSWFALLPLLQRPADLPAAGVGVGGGVSGASGRQDGLRACFVATRVRPVRRRHADCRADRDSQPIVSWGRLADAESPTVPMVDSQRGGREGENSSAVMMLAGATAGVFARLETGGSTPLCLPFSARPHAPG